MKTIEQLAEELEAVKKEREDAIRTVQWWIDRQTVIDSEYKAFKDLLSRLSSGETKVDDINVADLAQNTDGQWETKPESPWISVEDGPPAKPGKSAYEHVRCLVRGGKYFDDVLMWNCEHLCWDGEEGDDYECDFNSITWYLPLSAIPAPPESLTDKKQ